MRKRVECSAFILMGQIPKNQHNFGCILSGARVLSRETSISMAGASSLKQACYIARKMGGPRPFQIQTTTIGYTATGRNGALNLACALRSMHEVLKCMILSPERNPSCVQPEVTSLQMQSCSETPRAC